AIAALLLTLRGINRPNSSSRIWYFAGAGGLAGLAAGLKLTNLPFALGIAVAFLCVMLLERSQEGMRMAVRSMVAGGCAMVGVFLLSYGWWGMALLAHFGNPFFPSFNHLFRSEYAAPSAFSDPAFALSTFGDKLLFPFTRISIFGVPDWAGLF